MSLYIGTIDDDPDILYTLEAMASTQGWYMVTSTDPQTCFQWISGKEIDILLVDFHMPEMNGLEVIRKARELSGDVVLIALTIEDDEKLASELLLAGADDFITKPIHLADFKARIRLHGKLVIQRRSMNWDERKKGISSDTLHRVLVYIRDSRTDINCEDVSAQCDLSYVTAHRYMEYLSNRGLVVKTSILQDGKPGRPRSSYRWCLDK